MASLEIITSKIINIRGMRVIIDSDLAQMYGVQTKRLNEAYRRNIERFPEDFRFELTRDEVKNLRSQFATLPENLGRTYLPYVFSEHGAIMAANLKLLLQRMYIFYWIPAFAGMTRFFRLKVAL